MNRFQKAIIEWDNKYTLDLWFRKRYKIPFGSEAHRSYNFISMCMEFIEFSELERSKYKSEHGEEIFEEIKNNSVKMTKKELDQEFDNLDLNQF